MYCTPKNAASAHFCWISALIRAYHSWAKRCRTPRDRIHRHCAYLCRQKRTLRRWDSNASTMKRRTDWLQWFLARGAPCDSKTIGGNPKALHTFRISRPELLPFGNTRAFRPSWITLPDSRQVLSRWRGGRYAYRELEVVLRISIVPQLDESYDSRDE